MARVRLRRAAPLFNADVIEDQLGQFLAHLNIPADHGDTVVAACHDPQERASQNRISSLRQRRRLEAKADRLKMIYIDVESEPGRTVFRVRMPIDAQPSTKD